MNSDYPRNMSSESKNDLEEITDYILRKTPYVVDKVLLPLQQEIIKLNNLSFEKITPEKLQASRIRSLEKIRKLNFDNNRVLSEFIACIKYIIGKLTIRGSDSVQCYNFFMKRIFRGSRQIKKRINLLNLIILLDKVEYDEYETIDFMKLKSRVFFLNASIAKEKELDVRFLKNYKGREVFDSIKLFQEISHSIKDKQTLKKLYNIVDDNGDGLQHYCAKIANVDLCKFLVDQGVYIKFYNKNLLSPTRIALSHNNLLMIDTIINTKGIAYDNDVLKCKQALKMIEK